ncbi:MAG: hypothetical protein AB2L12_08135 [Smithellaceae bacterium]
MRNGFLKTDAIIAFRRFSLDMQQRFTYNFPSDVVDVPFLPGEAFSYTMTLFVRVKDTGSLAVRVNQWRLERGCDGFFRKGRAAVSKELAFPYRGQ